MQRIKDIFMDFAIPIATLLMSTFILSVMNADLLLAARFYSPAEGWLWKNVHPWIDLYHYGNIPPLILGLYGFIIFILGFFVHRIAFYRKIGLFLVIYLILGPGLVINTVVKDHWGRPRPVEVKNFGGAEQYLPVWERGTPGQGKSFPSGHAAVGFFLFAPFFLLRKQSPKWAVSFLLLGLAYGAFMGIGRMAQGGHFATDILWAWGLTYLTGLILSYIFRFDKLKLN
ncbi:MAG: phosphatase PAP2 family protein [Pseudomonadota bacterium]